MPRDATTFPNSVINAPSFPREQVDFYNSTFLGKEVNMAIGTVKWFNATKGYGFIAPDAGGPDVFVHISAVERSGLGSLKDGQKVNYEIVQDRRSGKSSADNLTAA